MILANKYILSMQCSKNFSYAPHKQFNDGSPFINGSLHLLQPPRHKYKYLHFLHLSFMGKEQLAKFFALSDLIKSLKSSSIVPSFHSSVQ